MPHIVVLTGEIMPGFKRKDIITNLCEIAKLSPETVEEKLLNGKPVAVKKLVHQAQAEQFCLALACAGVACEVIKR